MWQKYHAATKREKPLIAEALVDDIRDQTPSGRFLKFDSSLGQWQEVPFPQAREKACQCLRDTVASMIKAKKEPPKAPATAASPRLSNTLASKDQAPKKPQRTASRRDSFPPPRTVSAELEDMTPAAPQRALSGDIQMTLAPQGEMELSADDLEPIAMGSNVGTECLAMEDVQSVLPVSNVPPSRRSFPRRTSLDSHGTFLSRQTGITPSLTQSQPLPSLDTRSESLNVPPIVPVQSGQQFARMTCLAQPQVVVPIMQPRGVTQTHQRNIYHPGSQMTVQHGQSGLPVPVNHMRAPDFQTKPFQNVALAANGQPFAGPEAQSLKCMMSTPTNSNMTLRSVIGLNATRGVDLPPKQTSDESGLDLFSAEALEGITWEGDDMSLGGSKPEQGYMGRDGFRQHISQLLDGIELLEE